MNWEIYVQMGMQPKAKEQADVMILLDLGKVDITDMSEKEKRV